jgi:tetratricopeptide (TPR) repeat protein
MSLPRTLALRGGAAALAVLLCATLPAAAKPTIWDVARDSRTAKAYAALVAVERMMLRVQESAFDPSMQQNFKLAAIAMLELAGAKQLPDPRLRFLLAELLTGPNVHRVEQARQLLESALSEAPRSPLAAPGWFHLALASAMLGDSKREHHAYTQALELAWETDLRANIYLNRGESSMVLGDLRAAVADYRHAIQLAERPDLTALAYWGLGIAQERDGDLPSALASVAKAAAIVLPPPMPPMALDLPTVFFVPWYDTFYYKALTAMASARSAADGAKAREQWQQAIGYWRHYLSEAEGEAQPWVPNARRHLTRSERELVRLDKPRKARGERRAPTSVRDSGSLR